MKNTRKDNDITREDARLAISLEGILEIDSHGNSACFLLESFPCGNRFYRVDTFSHSARRLIGQMKK